jgi:hypothetical protein
LSKKRQFFSLNLFGENIFLKKHYIGPSGQHGGVLQWTLHPPQEYKARVRIPPLLF